MMMMMMMTVRAVTHRHIPSIILFSSVSSCKFWILLYVTSHCLHVHVNTKFAATDFGLKRALLNTE